MSDTLIPPEDFDVAAARLRFGGQVRGEEVVASPYHFRSLTITKSYVYPLVRVSAAATGARFPPQPAIGSDLDYSDLRGRLAGMSPEQIAADQRHRILAALPAALAEHGYRGSVVAALLRRAHVSRKTFYELFSGQDDAILACHREALAGLLAVIASGCAGEWPLRVRTSLTEALSVAASDPARARLVIGDPYVCGPHAGRLVATLSGRLAPHLRRGRLLTAEQLPSCLEDGLLGGVLNVILLRVYAGEAASLGALAPQLTEFLLAPYLGRAEAVRIACR